MNKFFIACLYMIFSFTVFSFAGNYVKIDISASVVDKTTVQVNYDVTINGNLNSDNVNLRLKSVDIEGNTYEVDLPTLTDSVMVPITYIGPRVINIIANEVKDDTSLGSSGDVYVKSDSEGLIILSYEEFRSYTKVFVENEYKTSVNARALQYLDNADKYNEIITVSDWEGDELKIPIIDSRGNKMMFTHGSRFNKALLEIAKSNPKYADNVQYYSVPADISNIYYTILESDEEDDIGYSLRDLPVFKVNYLALVHFSAQTVPLPYITGYGNCANMQMEIKSECWVAGNMLGTCSQYTTVNENGVSPNFEMWYAKEGVHAFTPFRTVIAFANNSLLNIKMGQCTDQHLQIGCPNAYPVFQDNPGDNEAALIEGGCPWGFFKGEIWNHYDGPLDPPGPTREWTVQANYWYDNFDTYANPSFCTVFPTLVNTRSHWYNQEYFTYNEYRACNFSQGLLFWPDCGTDTKKITFHSANNSQYSISFKPWMIAHEAGHFFHYNLQNYWQSPDLLHTEEDLCVDTFSLWMDYSEGFAEYFATETVGYTDPILEEFHMDGNEFYSDCTPSYNQTEGIIATFLADLFDNVNHPSYDLGVDTFGIVHPPSAIYDWANMSCQNISCFINIGKQTGKPFDEHENEICAIQCIHGLDDAAGLSPACSCNVNCECTSQ
ncbi:MAG TPA: hypothetical protein PK014_08430 [Thermoanaerobaculia bacterium]|nr:hypothetical protein [Thermoanaerobaculia bacterium]HUM30145.1 hypothetical protein [Thermoanaerobaculia bacterium]HXK68405.1 hypothetical protein [Thermoanaerobaculia bacterium]